MIEILLTSATILAFLAGGPWAGLAMLCVDFLYAMSRPKKLIIVKSQKEIDRMNAKKRG